MSDLSMADLAWGEGHGVWDEEPQPSTVEQPLERPLRVCQVYQLHGPPGCGKTSALARTWIPRAVDLYGPGGVAVCSLTKTAATEIASRDTGLNPENVGTLHALAFRALQRPVLVVNHLDDWNSQAPSKFQLAKASVEVNLDNPEDRRRKTERTGDEILQAADLLRHRRLPLWEWPDEEREFMQEWNRWKGMHAYYDFTDLIERALEETHAPYGNPNALIVDEAQDLSALERELVMHWSQSCDMLVLAGDGDQSIYTWRGADAAAFAANDGIPPDNQRELTQSYRVPGAVVEYAQQWIARHVGPRHPVAYRPRLDEEGNVVLGALLHAPHLTLKGGARKLVEDVEQQAEAGKSVMVLCTCSYMLAVTLKILREKGIPFHNPFRRTNGAWNPMRGGTDRLLSFLKVRQREGLWTWNELHQWTEHLRADPAIFRKGAKATIKRRLKNLNYEALNEPLSALELRGILTDEGVQAVLERAHLEDVVQAVEWFQEMTLPRHRPLFDYAVQIIRKRGLEALASRPQVIIGTVHSVKGGAADVVYLSPDVSKTGATQWDAGGTVADELVRVFYVGMTRARESLVLLGPTSRDCVRWPK